MNIDGVVRETLHSYADEAPSGAGLLDATRTRARRRRIRRTTAVVAAVAIGATLIATRIPYGASTDGLIVPESAPPSVMLVEPSFELPSFPFTPGWVPDGVEAPLVFYDSNLDWHSSLLVPDGYSESWVENTGEPSPPRSYLTLSHVPMDAAEAESSLWVSVYAADVHSYYRSIAADRYQLTVQDRPATRYVFGDGSELIAWRHEPDLWVTVAADEGIPRDDIERYADELNEDPLPASLPFRFELLPAAMDLTWTSYRVMGFTDPDEGWLEVYLTPEDYRDVSPGATPSAAPDQQSRPQAAQVEVAGRPATLVEGSNGSVLRVPLGQGLVLEVRGTLNEDDTLRVAEGIDLTPAARVPGMPASGQ